MRAWLRLVAWLHRRLLLAARARPADVVIGPGSDGAPDYLRRWWILPRNRVFNVYLHRFGASDDDRALHDHPWLFNLSVVLAGELGEIKRDAWGVPLLDPLRAGAVRFRWGAAPHRLELRSVHAWTLFVTGPRLREWGFYCPRGWVRWQDFTDPTDAGRTGPGCGS